MLTVRHIPQYEQSPESWDRFLYKAAIGFYKASDCLSYADMAYMAAVTGDPKAPENLWVAEYDQSMREYFSTCVKPDSAVHLASTIDAQKWFAFRLYGQFSKPLESTAYATIWSQGRSVTERSLLNDAIFHCHENWSANWLVEVLDSENCSPDYNSLNVVAAMLMLALTWKSS